MITFEIIQKHGASHCEKPLPPLVAAVLNECVQEMFATGMARDFGGAVAVRIEIQHSAQTTASRATHDHSNGFFRWSYDLIGQHINTDTVHRVVVNAGPQRDHRDIARTLAHEIGHCIDYLQNPDLFARKHFQNAALLETTAKRYASEMVARVEARLKLNR